MGMTTILNNGVLGLTAQSRALGSISSNIANAATTGYKATETQFDDVWLKDRSSNVGDPGAGVRAYNRLDNRAGTISQTGVTTNASILGNGYFVVQDIDFLNGTAGTTTATGTPTDSNVELTRAGDFSMDKDGYLVNTAGKALMGFKLDPNNPSTTLGATSSLKPVSLSGLTDYHEATTQASLAMNLPTAQAVAATPTLANTTGATLNLIDKSGSAGSTMLRFMKTGVAEDGSTTWKVYNAGTVGADGQAVGSVKASDPATWQPMGSLTFDRSGVLTGGANGSKLSMGINPGGNFGPVTVDLGTYGKPDDSVTSIADMDIGTRTSQNGIAAGSYQGAELTSDGYVAATFAGGRQRYLYHVPDAIVANPQDLENLSGTSFRTTTESGAIKLAAFGKPSGNGTSGNTTVGASLNNNSVEGSNVNIENQFTTLIQAQRTYSAASKLVSTADEMTQTTLTLKA
ncbi:flagellar hook protein FlgE [Azospirillum rugosum]|uniref:Flagellar hook protein FlgE n=1 Tax=Azospirillum rugosum TaxID=416170 RepID=A0ABS4SHY8_9PROT|nr:flagellar hook-basal body complex protein [Azospirillum rugosum]MBP2292183.1 flagellar hook protein FlgE [Azospirillum rugosum]MDQ0525681.1 flagellar hook protein FlgE [Azospirillum rugosum]